MTGAGDDLATRMAIIRQATVHGPEAGMTIRPRPAFMPELFARPGRDKEPDAQARFVEQIRRALHEDR